MTKNEAIKEAKALVKKLGKNWKYRVFENMGWYWNVYILDGRISIHEGNKGYWCLANFDKGFSPCGDLRFRTDKQFKDPKKAVRYTLKVMKKIVKHEVSVVLDLAEALNND